MEARYKGGSKYFPGRITAKNRDGTYDIRYADGDQERDVPARNIRKEGGGGVGDDRPSSPSRDRYGSDRTYGRNGDESKSSGDKGDHGYSERGPRRDIGLSRRGLDALRGIARGFMAAQSDLSSRSPFVEEDSESAGMLAVRDFKRALKRLLEKARVRDSLDDLLSDSDMSFITTAFADKPGMVQYDPFLAFVFDVDDDDDDLVSLEKRIHAEILKRKRVNDMIRAFSSFDSYKRGFVKRSDFERAMSKLGLKLSERDSTTIMDRFDRDREGVLDYVLFSNWSYCGSPANVDRTLSAVRAQLDALESRDVERMLDGSASRGGRLSRPALRDAFDRLGLCVTNAQVRALFVHLDPEDSGTVSTNAMMKLSGVRGGGGSGGRGGRVQRREAECLLPPAALTELSEALRLHVSTAESTLSHVLAKFDEDRSSALPKRQMRKALQEVGSMLSEDDEEALFEAFSAGSTVEGKLSLYDFVVFFSEEALMRDTRDVWRICRELMTKRRVGAKDVARAFSKSTDAKSKGFAPRDAFSRALVKLAGRTLSSTDLGEVENFLDPDSSGTMDVGLFVAMCAVVVDAQRAVRKLSACFRVLQRRGVDYRKLLSEQGRGSDGDGDDRDRDETGDRERERKDVVMGMEDVLSGLEMLSLPMSRGELEMVVSKFQRRGKVKFSAMMDEIEKAAGSATGGGNDGKGGSGTSSQDSDFGKSLLMKLRKLRAHEGSRGEFRRAVLQRDPELDGRVSGRDLQRAVDASMDLTDAEAALLTENMRFTDGSYANEVEYNTLLLMLLEPITRAPVQAGAVLMKKMLRSSDEVTMRRLLTLLFRTLAFSDPRCTGMVAFVDAEKALRDECPDLDPANSLALLRAFQDSASDCVLYPELLSFLACCSLRHILARVTFLSGIRLKQGYDFTKHLQKTATKGKKIDRTKAMELFSSIGILLPDAAVETLFLQYGSGKKNDVIDLEGFAADLAKHTEGGDDDTVAARRDVGGSRAFDMGTGADGRCEIQERILKEYDERVIRAVEHAFDLFDTKAKNEVPTHELERIICSLGQAADPEGIDALAREIDRRDEGVMEFHRFMDHIVPYLRAQYKSAGALTLTRLRDMFHALDVDSTGNLSSTEVQYLLQQNATGITSEEVNAFIDFLDVDGDRSLTWTEFSRVFSFLNDNTKINALEYNVRSSLRKLQFAFLPNPETRLQMFTGLPSNYRLSVLAGVAKESAHILEDMVFPPKLLQVNTAAGDVECTVRISKVSGVPSESSERERDIVGKSVKFCICRTDNPPTSEEPGDPPQFLGNVVTLRASRHAKHDDKWVFGDQHDGSTAGVAGGGDAAFFQESVVFVKATIPRLQDGEDVTQNELNSLYLFVELVTSVRVRPPNALSSKSKRGRSRGGGAGRSDARDSRDRESSPDRRDGGRHGGGTEVDESMDDQERDHDGGADDQEEGMHEDGTYMPVVEMCSGWTIVPLVGTGAKSTIAMHGGTPFLPFKVSRSDVRARKGLLHAMAGAVGYGVKSKIEVAVSTAAKGGTHRDTYAMSPLLPDNVVLPKSSVIAVALFRRLLIDQQCAASQRAAGRMLPQTGSLQSVEPLFGIFPRILADDAARGAFNSLWGRICPSPALLPDGTPATLAVNALHKAVMLVYRAMAQPSAIKPLLKPAETTEDINERRDVIMSAVAQSHLMDPSTKQGTSDFFNTMLGSFGASNSPTNASHNENTENESAGMNLEVNTPFNPRELIWTNKQSD